jgi:hypothetical protein
MKTISISEDGETYRLYQSRPVAAGLRGSKMGSHANV